MMSHLQKPRGLYAIIPLPNRDFGLNPALWLCFRTSHPRAPSLNQLRVFISILGVVDPDGLFILVTTPLSRPNINLER